MSPDFFEALSQIEKAKGIKKDVLIEAMKDALLSAYRKNFDGQQRNISVEFDNKDGFKIIAKKQVTEKISDSKQEILLSEAIKHKHDCQIGDVIGMEITPLDFGRIAAQTTKQVITQRIREAEREIVYKNFRERIGEIITGIVQRVTVQNILVDLSKIEATLPINEQIVKEKYRIGDRIKTYILDVKQATKGPQIILSRTHPEFVKKLFELEVPEIYEGIVEVKGVSREPGARSKIAVCSKDANVDPVGACVGMKGMRVQAVISELSGERIDIALYDDDPQVFIKNALSPAKIISVTANVKIKSALAVVPDAQLSLAIGKEGQNVRLAAKLTGWRIDIRSESEMNKERDAAARKQAEEELFKKPEVIIQETETVLEKLIDDTSLAVEVSEDVMPADDGAIPQTVETEIAVEKAQEITVIGMVGLDKKIAKKLQEAGIYSIEQINDMSVNELRKLPGIGKVSAEKIYNTIHQINSE
ncbi:transcription termination factor NusA [bacterium]|nr:transcription termination factor NusA [bacterium]MBU1752760.1 transcription termination factor NusA [bacterium]